MEIYVEELNEGDLKSKAVEKELLVDVSCRAVGD